MGLQSKKRLKVIVGTLKDKASLISSAASTSPASSAVLRATTHQPASEPARRRHLDALLAFGHGSRPAAASAIAAIFSRLRGTHDAAVALKCLLLAHHVARCGSFILRDQLLSALLQPPAGGGCNPLNLSAFRDDSTADSWALSAWVRWYARVLEQLLSCYRATGIFLNQWNGDTQEGEEERAASLPSADVLEEMDALVTLLEEVRRAPYAGGEAGSGLVVEVVTWVREDRAAAEKELMTRVREMGERMVCLGFGDGVVLTCLLRRLEGCRGGAAVEGELRWDVVAEVTEKVRAAMAREEDEQQRRGKGGAGQVKREKASESARIGDRVSLLSADGPLRFGSTRWSDR
ncbi:hypothetical protein Taro_028216 [Colocasia esculenta]|uniref:ENTH domain-containing protein n=1 Tax=Colocasia esculenta TaxID=4460 RepID=A0A843VTK2_COLES|nr:hypothetical protein [Colocasia esculenta]